MQRTEDKLFYGWFIVIASFLAILIFSIPAFSFGVFVDPLVNRFGWSRASISGGFSVFILISTFTAILSGRLSDKYGPRRIMGAGVIFVGAGFLFLSQLSSLTQFYLGFAVLGIGASTLYVPSISTLIQWFPEMKGKAAGITLSAFGVGMAFFPPLIEIIINEYGWSTTFFILGIVSTITLVFSAYLMKQAPSEDELLLSGKEAKVDKADNYTSTEVIRTPDFWTIYITFLLALTSTLLVTVHIVPYALEVEILPFFAATILSFIGIFNVLGRLLGGWATDKIGVIYALPIFLSIQVISILLLPVSTDLMTLYPLAISFGTAYGGWLMIYPVIVSELFGTAHLGSILGVFETFTGVGGAIGPYLAGYIFDVTGNYSIAFYLGGGLTAIAVLLSVLLVRIRSK